jgi:VWFA-related protein
MPRRGIRRGALAALLMIGAAASGQGQAPPSFSGTAQVFSVDVPVQVVRDGEPVRGLQAGDFQVWEGKRRLPVTGFEALDLTASAAGRSAAVPSAVRRHFLFLFDLAFSQPKAIVRARRAAAGLLSELHPTDLVAVATYSASRGPQLVLGFTSDRRQIENALGGLGLYDLTASSADQLRLVLQEVLGVDNAAAGAAPRLTRDPLSDNTDPAILLRLEAVTKSVEQADRSALKTRVVTFSKSLADLARQISVVEGRKYLVFLSEGFDASLVQGSLDAAQQEEIRQQSLDGEAWRTSPEERYGLTEVANALERMLEEFRRADCSIQAVNIGGLRAGADQGAPRLGGNESLLMLARGTGGELYESYNDLGAAMDQMLHRTSVTYVLAVQPDRAGPEGEFHRLRVELGKPVRGARLVHRLGYYPPKPYAEQDPIEKLLAAANQVMSGEESDAIATSVLAAPFRAPGGAGGEKAYVPVVIEIGGETLLAGQQPSSLPVEIYAYALDEVGAVHDFFSQTVVLNVAKVGAPLRQQGLKFFGHLDLLPGDYSLRVMVRNGVSGVSGLKVVSVRVPGAGAAAPFLLPPLIPEPPNRWLMVPEQPRGEDPAPPYPFLLRNQKFAPSVHPELPPGRDVRLVIAGYNLGEPPWKGTAAVVSADGHELPAGDLQIVDRKAGVDGAPDRAVATFRLPADLKPGEYTLRITVSGAAGSLRFTVPGRGARG